MPSKGQIWQLYCQEICSSWHSSVKRKAKRTFLFIVRKKTDKYWFCYTIKLLLRQIICHFAKLTSVNVVVKKHGSVSSFFVAQLMARGSISDLTHKKAVMWIGFGDFLHTLLIKCFFCAITRPFLMNKNIIKEGNKILKKSSTMSKRFLTNFVAFLEYLSFTKR